MARPYHFGIEEEFFLADADDDTNRINGRVRRQCVDRMSKHRFAADRPELLWDFTRHSASGPGGNDQCYDLHFARLARWRAFL